MEQEHQEEALERLTSRELVPRRPGPVWQFQKAGQGVALPLRIRAEQGHQIFRSAAVAAAGFHLPWSGLWLLAAFGQDSWAGHFQPSKIPSLDV